MVCWALWEAAAEGMLGVWSREGDVVHGMVTICWVCMGREWYVSDSFLLLKFHASVVIVVVVVYESVT